MPFTGESVRPIKNIREKIAYKKLMARVFHTHELKVVIDCLEGRIACPDTKNSEKVDARLRLDAAKAELKHREDHNL